MLRQTSLMRGALAVVLAGAALSMSSGVPGCLGRSDLEDPDAPPGVDASPVGGAAGTSGAAGRGGTGGRGGSAGTAGSAGRGGSGGTAGSSGTAGSAGTSGAAGQPGCGPDTCPGCCDRVLGSCTSGTEIIRCGIGGVECSDCAELGFACTNGVCLGPPPQCGPDNCSGCCDASGQCRLGSETDACGVKGASCVDCAARNQGCVAGACQGMPPACGPGNCGGCCDARGQCRPGNSDASCGADGALCTNCASNGRVCTEPGNYCAFFPSCSSVTCPTGCCDAEGICRNGRTDSACGASGQRCSDCSAAGQACAAQGFCYAGPHCGPDNCAGCCTANGQCRNGAAPAACGQYGALCDNCASKGETCQNRVCTGGATCPADYPGCNPGAVTTPPFSAASCGSGELDALAAACTGGGTSTACAQFFQRLLSANPRCYDCMLQFTGSDAYTRCVAPFLTQSCNHDLTCALDCSNVACDRCPTAQEGTCRQLAFDAGTQCNAWINGYYCLQAALGGPAEFCDVERYAGAGDWLRAVGEQYCRR